MGSGVLTLYSAAGGQLDPWASKQLLRFGVAVGVFFSILRMHPRFWFQNAYFLYCATLILLIIVECSGRIGMGGQRWIDLYIFQLQPSELMRVALILALARYFQSLTLRDVQSSSFLVIPIILILVPTALVVRQPDLGTATMLIFSGGMIFFTCGVQIWKFISVLGIVAASIPFLWSHLYLYQKKRILIFLNPESDPLRGGYHILQSKIALGSGGLWGKGFLKGTQSHLHFLPEKQTDFIFAMFGEEFGFFGGAGLLCLFGCLLLYGYSIVFKARTFFSKIVAMGLTSTIFLYILINVGMVMGLFPVVGIPLPFLSYGGTSIMTIMITLALLIRIGGHD